jgi:hypothetical protein
MQLAALSENQHLDGMRRYSATAIKFDMHISSIIIIKPNAWALVEYGLRAYR